MSPAPRRRLLGPRARGWTFFDPLNLTALLLLTAAALLNLAALAGRGVLDWEVILVLYASLLVFLRAYLFHVYEAHRWRRVLVLLVLLFGLLSSGGLLWLRAAPLEILRGGQRVRLEADHRFTLAAALHALTALLLALHALTSRRGD
ncbi:hypothetical protein KKB55_15955 [Myxococcota bacterium]|nr:hypothetical protein [Myxococcota bacterium]MBU1899235.1 hypothetical protein [Myxococcota bacterium]